jgi:hypothetical protein
MTGYVSNSTCMLVVMMMMMFLKELFITLNIKILMILTFLVMQTMMKYIIIVRMKNIRLMKCNDDVYGDIRHQIYGVRLYTVMLRMIHCP